MTRLPITNRPRFRERPLWFHHLMALTSVTIWSFSFYFIIAVNRELTPLGVVVFRKSVFAGLVIGLLLWRRPSVGGLSLRHWAVVIGLGLAGGPIYHTIFAWSAGTNAGGVSRIDPGLLGLILATVPVHTGWLAWLFLRERLTMVRIAALGLGLAGIAIVLTGRYGRIDLLPREHLEGPTAATVAAIVGACLAVLTRAARAIFHPIDLVAVSGTFIVLLTLPLLPWAEMGRVADLSPLGWTAGVFLGLFGSGISFMTWAAALVRLQAVTAAMYLFLASLLSALWGKLFDGHPIGWPFIAGAALVLAGLLIMARQSQLAARVRRAAPAPALPDADPA